MLPNGVFKSNQVQERMNTLQENIRSTHTEQSRMPLLTQNQSSQMNPLRKSASTFLN